MFKNVVYALIALTIGSVAHAADKTFPKTFAEFEKLSQSDMAALPDLKWPIGHTVTANDVKAKSETELAILRNSVFAQYGYPFTQKALAQYFGTRSWYHPNREETKPLSTQDRAAAEMFLQAQNAHDGRNVADEDGPRHSVKEQAEIDVYDMGFCTYKGQNDPKAGVIVFDTNGTARVYHSVASDSYHNNGNSYDNDVFDPKAKPSTRMLDARWSLETKSGGGAHVLLTYDMAKIPKDWDGKPVIEAGVREVLDTSNAKAVKAHDCTMLIRKTK